MATTSSTETGRLQINLTSSLGFEPVVEADIRIFSGSEPDRQIEEVHTNISGQTIAIPLPAPSLAYSMEPNGPQPFSNYNIEIRAEGYRPVNVNGIEVLPDVTAVQPVSMTPDEIADNEPRNIDVPVNTLFGDYPPKMKEAEIKPLEESGEIVLSRVVIPEYVIVHDGPPGDRNARDYYVRYRDYIKNVASSEIYATWPDAALRANILAMMSFTLNRVFTEWYRNKGYNFTITSSTAYDQKWSYGRNIFDNISLIVDEMFNSFLARPNVRQPILTQYCDGKNVTCPRWLSQWGSKYLADQGYSAIEILRYYYGDTMYINTAEEIAGVPASWPGYDLQNGSSGSKVRQMQQQLNVIARNFPAIPRIAEDGIFGPATEEAVSRFQSIFGLPATGVVDFATWYKISQIYVGVSRIAELV